MMVSVARDLIDDVLLSVQGGLRNAVLRQKVQRTVYRWLRKTTCFSSRACVDLGGKQMRSRLKKHVEDGQTLSGYAEAKRTKLWHVLGGARHDWT